MAERVERLGLYEPKDILPLAVRTGTGQQPMQILGNSFLSVLFIRTIDPGATVSVKYYDTGSGTDKGEKNFVGGHADLTATTPEADRILVTRMTNKTVLEWTVTGGSAEFGAYAFVVSSFASDLDNALQENGAIADLMNDKGIVVMGYDEAQGKYYFLPMSGGALVTTPAVDLPGSRRLMVSTAGLVTNPGSQQNLINQAVTAGETWIIRAVEVVCPANARFTVYADGVRIGSGRTGPMQMRDIVEPSWEIAATKVVLVEFLETSGPVTDVECYVRATKI